MQDIYTILKFYRKVAELKNKLSDDSISDDNKELVAIKKDFLHQNISLVIRIRKVDNSGISGRIMPEDKAQMNELFEVEESTGKVISQTLGISIWQEDFVSKMIAETLQKDDLLKVEGTIGDIDEFFLLVENISAHEIIKNSEDVDLGTLMIKQRIEHQITANQKAKIEVLSDEETGKRRKQELNLHHEKLLRKSKVWSGWGTAFLIIAGVAVVMVLSKDFSQVVSVAFWGGLGMWFKKKSKEYKQQADNFFTENVNANLIQA